MTDGTPETAAVRKVRVRLSQPPPSDRDYWRRHVQIVDCDDDPTFDACEEDLDLWIGKRRRREKQA